jgi:CHAD domain-containing protein
LAGSSTLISTACGYIARAVRASRFLTAPLRAVQQQEGKLPGKAAVHQVRVTARKLRASLRILRFRELDPAVKELQDALGKVRDQQLQVVWLRGRDAVLLQASKRKLRTAERALDRALRQWNSRTVPALLQASEDARQPAPRKLSKMLRKRLQRLEERLEAARKRPTPKTLHRARISVKQVRYLLQVAKEALPKKAHRLDADLKSLQASLGELHDADVRIALIKHRPKLLRAEREARERLAKVVDAQLARWHGQKVAARTQQLL